MKKLFVSLGVITTAGLVCFGVPCDHAVAISGCCKERVGTNKWRNIGNEFAKCKQLNSAHDKDDILQPSNKYWWDVGC